ncbi:MAG: hypothetical protein ABIE68_03635 [bacterium]
MTIPKYKNLPKGMQIVINGLRQCESKEECLRRAYNILTEKYYGRRVLTYIKLLNALEKDYHKLWSKEGFMHCNKINYLLKILLLESKHFLEKDIVTKWTLIFYFSPHQYLQIKVAENKFINIDIWGKAKGIEFGDHAHGFH